MTAIKLSHILGLIGEYRKYKILKSHLVKANYSTICKNPIENASTTKPNLQSVLFENADIHFHHSQSITHLVSGLDQRF